MGKYMGNYKGNYKEKDTGKQYDNRRAGRPIGPGNTQTESIDDKNYFFIEDGERPRIDLSRYGSGKAFYGKLALDITALQDLFIGCGEIEENAGRLYDTFSYVKPEPGKKTRIIPGSSLKGSVYTNLEMILQAESFEFYRAKDEKTRVFFTDIPLVGGAGLSPHFIPARFSPANSREERIKYYLKEDPAFRDLTQEQVEKRKNKENLLILKKGSRFRGFIHFRELDETRLALLILAMGALPGHRFNFKLGGAKNRALGLIKLEIIPGDSYYSEKLLHAVKARALPYKELEPALVSVADRLEREKPKLTRVLAKIREEYGQ